MFPVNMPLKIVLLGKFCAAARALKQIGIRVPVQHGYRLADDQTQDIATLSVARVQTGAPFWHPTAPYELALRTLCELAIKGIKGAPVFKK